MSDALTSDPRIITYVLLQKAALSSPLCLSRSAAVLLSDAVTFVLASLYLLLLLYYRPSWQKTYHDRRLPQKQRIHKISRTVKYRIHSCLLLVSEVGCSAAKLRTFSADTICLRVSSCLFNMRRAVILTRNLCNCASLEVSLMTPYLAACKRSDIGLWHC